MLAVTLSLVLASGAAPQAPGVCGRVTDRTDGGLPGVAVVLVLEGGGERTAVTDAAGRFEFPSVPPGRHRVIVRALNFADVRRDVLVADAVVRLDLVLEVSLSASVAVTAQRTFRNLAEVERPQDSLVGLATSAGVGAITAQQIEARPLARPGEVLETVPGVIATQHSGEGKANQYFLRGFNLDHGTDFLTTVAGMPVNMPTHAHGQGYSDVNFIIPELISGVQYRKGPYFADQGDFSAAGAASINYATRLDAPIVEVSAGDGNWLRTVVAGSRSAGAADLLYAIEANHNDGPWKVPEDHQRLSGVLRYSRGGPRAGLSITAMAYDAKWNASDQVPRRATQTSILPRFGSVDSSDGGRTHRISLSAEAQWGSGSSETHLTSYVVDYGLVLFSNFTYFLEDPERGDQFEQRDERRIAGGRLLYRRLGHWGGMDTEHSVGGELRHDDIGLVGLYRSENRRRHATVAEDAVEQSSAALFAQTELRPVGWLRAIGGLRLDGASFEIQGVAAHREGLVSPKGSLVFGPWAGTELYANAGRGFHSNDARAIPAARTALVRADGAELGLRTVAVPGVQMTVAAWTLALESELVFVGDAGTTEAGRPSRRSGVEWSAYVRPASWVQVDADVSLSRGRFTDSAPEGARIPGAVGLVASAGLSLDMPRGVSAALRWRHVGSRPLVESALVKSKPTGLVNGQIGCPLGRRLRVQVDVLNLLDTEASDIEYLYTSRLPGEPPPGIEDIHTHPVGPRMFRGSLRVTF